MILWLAFAIGCVFGGIGQKTHFCTMGAVSDIVNMGDWSRMRMWLLAIGGAILYETGEELFPADSAEAITPGGAYPKTVLTAGELAADRDLRPPVRQGLRHVLIGRAQAGALRQQLGVGAIGRRHRLLDGRLCRRYRGRLIGARALRIGVP